MLPGGATHLEAFLVLVSYEQLAVGQSQGSPYIAAFGAVEKMSTQTSKNLLRCDNAVETLAIRRVRVTEVIPTGRRFRDAAKWRPIG